MPWFWSKKKNKMIRTIRSEKEFEDLKKKEGVLFYFSHEECNVCKVLKPKIHDMLSDHFPGMEMCYVNVRELPAVAGQESVFAVPTISVLFDGREFIRKSRNIGLQELYEQISRPYSILFEN